MIISLVVAHGKNRQIGLNNKLLWHISEDLKNFKKITMGQTMVMGRKTFDSIGRVLPHRQTWILTHDHQLKIEGTKVFTAKADILSQAKQYKIEELFIVGGEMIYKLFLPEAKRVYLTEVNYEGEADAFFPSLPGAWKRVHGPVQLSPEGPWSSHFSILERE